VQGRDVTMGVFIAHLGDVTLQKYCFSAGTGPEKAERFQGWETYALKKNRTFGGGESPFGNNSKCVGKLREERRIKEH